MNIYFSRSNDVQDRLLNAELGDFCQNLPISLGEINITKHDRDQKYNPLHLKRADLVIVGITNESKTIGKGCFEEIKKAQDMNIPILYLITDKDDNAFFTNLSGGLQEGGYDKGDSMVHYAHLETLLWSDWHHDETLSHYIEAGNEEIDLNQDYTFHGDSKIDVLLYFEAFVQGLYLSHRGLESKSEKTKTNDDGPDQDLLLLC